MNQRNMARPQDFSFEATTNHIHLLLTTTQRINADEFGKISAEIVCDYCKEAHPEKKGTDQCRKCVVESITKNADGHRRIKRVFVKPWRTLLQMISRGPK